MWANIDLQEELTIGKLRELVTTGKLSEFPNDTPIKMCINLYTTNVDVVSEIKNLLNRYPETKEIELYGVEDILKQCKAEILTNFENTSDIEITINKGE